MRHRTSVIVLIGLRLMAGRNAWAQQESSTRQEPSTQLQSSTEQSPSAESIVARMQAWNAERQGALESYTGERTYRVEYHGTGGEHHGEINVHVSYGDHGEKHLTVVSETGSKLICERVLRKMVETEQEASARAERTQSMLSAENYSFQLEGQETVDGMKAWVLRVTPKVENKLMYRGRVWVSEDDFAVMRVQGEPAKNPSFWINHASFDWKYGRHGRFWLPERSEAVSHVRIGGEAKLTIEYEDYHVVSQRQVRDNVEVAQHVVR